jgi:hypothetical protein
MDVLPHESGRWGTVAASVMRRPGLSIAAKATYAALATYADRHGWIWVRQSTLAAGLERSRPWVLAALADLEAAGLLQHDRRYVEGRQRASRYRLLDGLIRFAATDNQPGNGADKDQPDDSDQVSDVNDSGVSQPNTNHHEESSISLSAEGMREPDQSPDFPEREEQNGVVPADWMPTTADVTWATARHPRLDVLAFTERFVLTCQAKSYRYSDPSAAWRRWLIEPKGHLPLLPPSPAIPWNADQDLRHERPANHHEQQRHSAPTERPSPGLAEHNSAVAAAALERILARRAGGAAARHPG